MKKITDKEIEFVKIAYSNLDFYIKSTDKNMNL